jgi:rubrerythrin
MGPKTTANLKAAFAGESQAHMKYLEFADLAKKEGFANVSRLFTAISFAERVHATNHHRVLSEIGRASCRERVS